MRHHVMQVSGYTLNDLQSLLCASSLSNSCSQFIDIKAVFWRLGAMNCKFCRVSSMRAETNRNFRGTQKTHRRNVLRDIKTERWRDS